MVGLPELWLPILVAAVLVFVASSIIHTLLPYHRTDFRNVPEEDALMEAMRELGVPAGDLVVPHAESPEILKSEAYREKAKKGPVVFMTVLPPGDPFAMGARLTQWFLYALVVGLFAAYVTGRALGPGADYLAVFRFSGVTAFVGYSLAHAQRSIWYGQRWSTTLKNMFDGLVYGLLTAGAFGWLWPEM